MSGELSMHNDDNNKDDGSVWTSYSDLFTTVAVIFLVMFVFALIKAGVSKMQTVVAKRNHEQELKGAITKKSKKETEQKLNKVNKTITDIANYENLIDQKMKDMNKFVSSLQENKKVLNELIKDQQRKETQLFKASELIQQQENEIKNSIAKNENLSEKLEVEKNLVAKKVKENLDLTNTIKKKESAIQEKVVAIQDLTQQQQELTQNYQESLKNIESLKVVKQKKQKQIKDLSKNLAQMTLTRSKEIADYTQKIKENAQKIEQLKNEVVQNEQVIKEKLTTITQKEQVIANNEKLLNQQSEELNRKKELMDKQIVEINRLSSKSQNQQKNIQKLQVDLANRISEFQQQQSQNQQLTALNEKQKQKMEFLENQLNQETMKFRETAMKLDKTEDQLAQTIADLTKTKSQKVIAENQASALAKDKDRLQGMLTQVQQRADNLDSNLKSTKLDLQNLNKNYANLKQNKENLENENLQQVAQMAKLNAQIAKLGTDNNYLQQKLSDKALNIKTLERSLANVQRANQGLEKKNQDLNNQNQQIKAQMDQVASQNNYLMQKNNLLNQQNTANNQKIAQLSSELLNEKQNGRSLNQEIENLKNQNALKLADAKRRADMEKNDLKTDYENRINKLKSANNRKIASVESELDKLKQSNPVQEQKIASLNQQNQKVTKSLNTCEKDLGFRKQEVATLEKKFKEKFKNGDKNNALLLQCKSSADKLVSEKKNLENRNKNLKESLDDFAKKVANVKGKLRSNIAKDLAKAFKDAKLNVLVDNKTGNVVLQMNENFRFKKNSFYLNKRAKASLKKIIPIYSKVLFGNKEIKNKISSFNVVGHASPSFRGKFVAPDDQNSRAYSYNMRLSAQRASSITNYIFSKSIGNYDHKSKLQLFTKAIGQGYIKPVKNQSRKGRKIASSGACGPYDCYSSQRVEISFTLKDDVNSINELIEMAKDIK